MEQTISKNWLLVILGVGLILVLRWINQHWLVPSTESVKPSGFSYEMPRPHSYTGSFDLSGREIDRQVLSDEEAAQEAAKKDGKPLDKKSANKANKKQAQNKDTKNRDKKFQVDVVDSGFKSTLSMDSLQRDASAGEVVGGLPAHANNPAADDGSDNNKDTRTAAQWLELLSSHATSQLITEFETAHLEGQVTDGDFYNIAFTLFTSQAAQNQQTGTEILGQDTGRNGFLYMAQEYNKLGTGNGAALWTIMVGYAQSASHYAALNVALGSSSTTVVPLALQVVKLAVTNAQQLNSAGAGAGKAGVPAQSLKIFESNLAIVAATTQSDASQASALLKQIQALLA